MTTTALPTQTAAPTRRRFTVDEFLAMDQAGIFHPEERLELLDGAVSTMPPIGPPRADGTDQFDDYLKFSLRGRARVRVQGPVQLDDLNLPVPDIAVLRLRDDYHRAHPTPTDVLLIVEVSDSSLRRDREAKLPRYAAAGIPEVWIANLHARQIEAFSDPADGICQNRRIVPADGQISPIAFPDVVLTVGEFLLGVSGSEGDATGATGTNP